jgi:small subunit ribosomal protein S13
MTKFLLYMKIAGTEISDNKHVVISLCGIFGIGKTTSIKILEKLALPKNKKVKDLTDLEQQMLADELDNYVINNDLQREILNNINRLVSINCYRGKRLKAGLPSHGQRTHANGKTAKRNSKFGSRMSASTSSNKTKLTKKSSTGKNNIKDKKRN